MSSTFIRPAVNNRSYLRLLNVPTSATPADIRRLISRSKAVEVSEVALSYLRFKPIGQALLTHTRPGVAARNFKYLDKTTISGQQIRTKTVIKVPIANPRTGTGPNAGLPPSQLGKTVLLAGLSPKDALAGTLKMAEGFALEDMLQPIYRAIPSPGEPISQYARCLIHFASPSEAHRFVREYHRTGNLLASIIH